MLKKHRAETLTYLVLWTILFMAPVLSLYISTIQDSSVTFQWHEVLQVWRPMAFFLAIFLLHNHLLAPVLIYRQKRLNYFTGILVLVALFAIYQCSHRPTHEGPGKDDGMELSMQRPTPPEGHRPDMDGEREHMRPRPEGRPEPPHAKRHRPPLFTGQHDLVALVILILMLGMNLGVKLYFKQRRDQLRLAQTQQQQLEQQLEYLKYQLNPHFLMNTLNNIHALVDIDSEEAKEAIINLSRLLRYVLYESNRERVPMQKEVEFMDNYVRLMRIRYTDKLSFTSTAADDDGGILIPPLLFISFVENAFKHGVSYQEESFIDVASERYKNGKGQQRLRWTCRNSKHAKAQGNETPRQGGVGMKNVRQRLDILYGRDYTLDIRETETTFEVTLDIPLET